MFDYLKTHLTRMESTLHYTSVSHSDNLMSMINKMRLSSDLCDVTIVIGNFRVMAHKIILSASAPFFYEMFKPCQHISTNPEYYLKDMDETSALKIIEFCYTSAISLDEETVWPLFHSAVKLGCSEIASLCCEFLTSSLDISTCIRTHLMAYRNNCLNLLSNTRHFIIDNYKKLCTHSSVETLTYSELLELINSWKNSPSSNDTLYLKFVESWLEHNTQDKRQNLLKLIQEFPEYSDNLHHLSTVNHKGNDSTSNCETAANNSAKTIITNKVATVFTSDDISLDIKKCEGQQIPLHICVSCGDAFGSQDYLSAHQQVCYESARSAPQNIPAPQEIIVPDCDKPVANSCSASYFIKDNDLLTGRLTTAERLSVSHKDFESNICSEQNDSAKKEYTVNQAKVTGDPVLYIHNTEKKHIPSDDFDGKTQGPLENLNDRNNNDIHGFTDDNDNTGDEIDVVNDDDDCHNETRFKLNFLINATTNTSSITMKCQICDKIFSERKMLAKHWKCVHGMKEEADSCSLSNSLEINDSGIIEESDLPHDQVLSNKKIKLEIQDKLGFQEKEKLFYEKDSEILVKQDSSVSAGNEPSEFIKQYLHQYTEFTKWCMEQGAMLCHKCLMYHPRESICPCNRNEQEVNEEIGRLSMLDNKAVETIDTKQVKSEDIDEGPLDMSKHSSNCSSSNVEMKILNSQQNSSIDSTAYFPSPFDITQYYNNLSHIMAAAHTSSTSVGQYSLLHPSVKSYLSFQQSSPFPVNFDVNVDQPNYAHLGRSSPLDCLVPAHQKKKVSPRQRFFPCTVCNRVFSYQAALFTHMRTHSPSVQIYQCSQCHQNFAHSQDLKVHQCPNGIEKPYTCSSCGQTFAKNIHLKRHLATHSGLKPYPCWVCGKRFSRSDHLKRHTQSIHAGSRPHACQTCGKEFVRKYELNKHLLSHNLESVSHNSCTLDLSQSNRQKSPNITDTVI